LRDLGPDDLPPVRLKTTIELADRFQYILLQLRTAQGSLGKLNVHGSLDSLFEPRSEVLARSLAEFRPSVLR